MGWSVRTRVRWLLCCGSLLAWTHGDVEKSLVGSEKSLVEVVEVGTRGAAGWSHFSIQGEDYLAVANFFTSSPRKQQQFRTDSAVYRVEMSIDEMKLVKIQHFRTAGAHGVEHFVSKGENFLAVPNYFGDDTLVMRWVDDKFEEHQRLETRGGGSVEAFRVKEQQMLAVAEFDAGEVSIWALKEKFEERQRLLAPGVGAVATMEVGNDVLLLAACYHDKEAGWRPKSLVFKLIDGSFKPYQELATVGAHDVEVASHKGRHFAFFSYDRDETSTDLQSELFELVDSRFISRGTVPTHGAHAAEFFVNDERLYLAVANLGDRAENTYSRDSHLYELQLPSAKLELKQALPTRGATDFHAFQIKGRSFLAVSNEQDEVLGADIPSTIWEFKLAGTTTKTADASDEL